MKLSIYQVDTFTDILFKGNPACVVPLDSWLDDEILLNIAKENAVPETAFFVELGDKIHLRWFTPEIEMDLCEHATLATAHCIKTIHRSKQNRFLFTTQSGELTVSVNKKLYTLDFPSRIPIKADVPEIIRRSLSIQPIEVLKSRDYVLVYEHEADIRNIKIDRQVFDQINLDPGGVVITSRGDNCDFVSRYFIPQASILEDPVTGSTHCSLIPYWAERLNKKYMVAFQLSDRMGRLECINNGERVLISGNARTYSKGKLWTN